MRQELPAVAGNAGAMLRHEGHGAATVPPSLTVDVDKELGLGSISIGTPFFNHIYSWLIIPFALLLGVGPLFRWRRQELGELKGKQKASEKKFWALFGK